MLKKAREVDPSRIIETDLCVIGAGAAGITIAREWIGDARKVVVLESGGFDLEAKTQALYEGKSTGTFLPEGSNYLHTSRLRFFGGTTNHWAGQCRPLDEIDFQPRPWVPYSGWPYPKSHLLPFYRRATSLLDIAPFDYELSAPPKRALPPVLLGNSQDLQTKFFHYSSPTRFGVKYRSELIAARNIDLYLQANAVELETNEVGSTVTRVRVACLGGPTFWVKARHVVLAVGALENSRLLLTSRTHQPLGLGNNQDLVGRFFMEHLYPFPGELILHGPASTFTPYKRLKNHPLLGRKSGSVLATTPAFQREEGLLNFAADLFRESLPIEAQTIRAGIAASLASLRRPGGFGRGGVARNKTYFTRFLAMAEQSPNPESRVTLSDEKDALGMNKLKLDWRVSAGDYRSIKLSADRIAKELGAASLGRVSVEIRVGESELAPTPLYGFHHMGTTRMSDDPKQGVVDADCRVHGVSNLFIAGSSTFPTCGYANPTLTLVALALLLSDHLKQKSRS